LISLTDRHFPLFAEVLPPLFLAEGQILSGTLIDGFLLIRLILFFLLAHQVDGIDAEINAALVPIFFPLVLSLFGPIEEVVFSIVLNEFKVGPPAKGSIFPEIGGSGTSI